LAGEDTLYIEDDATGTTATPFKTGTKDAFPGTELMDFADPIG